MDILKEILEITNIDVYIEKPKYLLIPIILTMISVLILMNLPILMSTEEISNWTLYQWTSIILIFLAFFIVAVGAGVKIKRWIWDEKQYNKVIKEPFEIHFIIPPEDKYKIDYYKQTNVPLRVDKIPLPANSKRTIFLWIKSKIDINIRERQFGFGDKLTDPKILKYDNPYIRKSNVPLTWYIDWWDNYHIYDKISRGKDDVIVHGFKIETHDKGEYTLDIRINVSSNRYKNVEKYKTYVPHYTNLKINVI